MLDLARGHLQQGGDLLFSGGSATATTTAIALSSLGSLELQPFLPCQAMNMSRRNDKAQRRRDAAR